jgi:FG-GAP repeat
MVAPLYARNADRVKQSRAERREEARGPDPPCGYVLVVRTEPASEWSPAPIPRETKAALDELAERLDAERQHKTNNVSADTNGDPGWSRPGVSADQCSTSPAAVPAAATGERNGWRSIERAVAPGLLRPPEIHDVIGHRPRSRFDGDTGDIVHQFNGTASPDHFGIRIATGDVNGDEQTDVIVGAEWGTLPGTPPGSGYVRVHDGASGAVIAEVNGSCDFADQYNGDHLGLSLAVHDVNGDGKVNILTGAPDGDSTGLLDNGYVRLFPDF